MATVRCKMECISEERSAHYDRSKGFLYTYKFQAVYGSSAGDNVENQAFWEATPSGNISLTCVKSKMFEPGRMYLIDFQPVEVIIPNDGQVSS